MFMMTRSFFSLLSALAAGLVLASGAVRAEQPVDYTWTLVVGSDPLEKTAAEDLLAEFAANYKIPLQGPLTAEQFTGSGPVIAIGTAADNPLIRRAQQSKAFQLNESEPESYHLLTRDGNLYIVGQSAKGAMNGVFRFEDRRATDVENLDEAASPAFHLRVGGHRENQAPPAWWSEDDQARYYAKNYINVCWGEKRGAPLGFAARSKWGVGLMLEATLPPVGSVWLKRPGDEAWMKDPVHASCIYYWGKKSWYNNVTVIDPFDPVGRQAYVDYFRRLLKENPDTRVLYAIFGDYSWAPNEDSKRVSDGRPFGHTQEESVEEILKLMRETIHDGGYKDVTPGIWMWLLHPKEGKETYMKKMAAQGIAVINNEMTNGDNWIHVRDNFDKEGVSLRSAGGHSAYGDNYLILTSIGGSCETVEPAIGLPLPYAASAKLQKIHQAGVRNFIIWWASCEGWVYQANLSAIREMIWNPGSFDARVGGTTPFDPAHPEPLMKKIAERDFGAQLAPEALDLWRSFDAAFMNVDLNGNKTGLQIFDWNQRLGCYTNWGFLQAYKDPIIPSVLSDQKKYSTLYPWALKPEVHDNFKQVIDHLAQTLEIARALKDHAQSAGSPAAAKKAADMWQQINLLRMMLASEYNTMRGLSIVDAARVAHRSDAQLRQELLPITRDEIALMRELMAFIPQFPPNFNLGEPMVGVVRNQGSVEKELIKLNKKVKLMQDWADGNK